MSECYTSAERLEQRERELALLLRLDRIRDQTLDMNRFVTQAANALVEAVEAHLCIVGLVREDEAPRVVPAAVLDRLQVLSRLDHAVVAQVLEQAISLDDVVSLVPGKEFLSHRLDHLLAAPLVVGESRLGAIVMARCERQFTALDLDLVRAAASQVDSAVMHLRTFQSAQERARQLEAVYCVDRIRDEADGASGILPEVVHVAVDALHADLGMIALLDPESGQNQIRAVEDRNGVYGALNGDDISMVLAWATALTRVGVLEGDSLPVKKRLGPWVGAPLTVAGEQLGCLVLARQRLPFDRADRDLLAAIASQTDSAVVHARAQHHLRQRNKELETLYRVDRIRDQGYSFGEMLSAVLSELCTVIAAEMGFIMLFDSEGRQLELRASTADDILACPGHHHLIDRAAREALRVGSLYVAQDLSEWLHSIMCVPLILRERIIGVFGAVNRLDKREFTSEDRRLLLAITSQVDTAIFESMDKQRIQETFRRYVGPRVMERMLAMPERDYLKGERAHLTVLFTDMRGFTSMGERVPVDVLVEMLNMHLGAMTEIVLAYEGTLDKFVADQVVAIFGAPLPMRDHAIRAVQAAVEMQAVQQGQIEWWAARGYPLPPIGIGINTGEMVVGNIGCEQQMDYTVIGSHVNLASRLCDVAAGNQTLVSEATYGLVAERVRANKLARYDLHGIQEPVQVYEIGALK